MSGIKRGFVKFLPLILFLVELSSFAQEKNGISAAFVDPEVQFYFEDTIGYRKIERLRNGTFRDSPVSAAVRGELLRPALVSAVPLTNAPLQVTEYRKTNFDAFPLYYDLKASDKPGPLSSFVLEPSHDNGKAVAGYVMVDIVIRAADAPEFYGDFMKKMDFFLAGEQDVKEEAESWKIVFGWISRADIDLLRTGGVVKGFSYSARPGLRAPTKEVSLFIKAPVNRDYSVFFKAFVEEMKKFGFKQKSSENIPGGRNSRFSLTKITGELPVDRIEPLLSNPFVLKVSSP